MFFSRSFSLDLISIQRLIQCIKSLMFHSISFQFKWQNTLSKLLARMSTRMFESTSSSSLDESLSENEMEDRKPTGDKMSEETEAKSDELALKQELSDAIKQTFRDTFPQLIETLKSSSPTGKCPKCPVCKDPLQELQKTVDLLTLKCGHLFCKTCVDKLSATRPLKCPSCSMRYKIIDIRKVFLPWQVTSKYMYQREATSQRRWDDQMTMKRRSSVDDELCSKYFSHKILYLFHFNLKQDHFYLKK